MNTAIELHDSTIGRIVEVDGGLLVEFSPVYVHQSEGQPGLDPGIGWSQDARLHLSAGVLHSPPPSLPAELWGGQLRGAGVEADNVIPVPLNALGAVALHLEIGTGETLTITGTAIRLELAGQPGPLEAFTGIE